MTKSQNDFLLSFNTIVDHSKIFIFITTDSDLQTQALQTIVEKLLEIGEEKSRAIKAAEEDYANCLLGCECCLKRIANEIQMWLHLKEGASEKAWEALVDAQVLVRAAMRAHRGFWHMTVYSERLDDLEQLVFPPQVFMSSGLIVRDQLCSICGRDYEDCEHLAGMAYMGSFCGIRAGGLEVDHVAIVDAPSDKSCRVTSFRVEGGYRNRMTWKIEPDDSKDADNENDESSTSGGMIKATIMRAR